MYYLNVMAGPGETRQWLIRDHPDHGWIRDTWPGQAVDPRLPVYGAPPTRPPQGPPQGQPSQPPYEDKDEETHR